MILRCFDGVLQHEFSVQFTSRQGFFGTYSFVPMADPKTHYYSFDENGDFTPLGSSRNARTAGKALKFGAPPNKVSRRFVEATKIWYTSLQASISLCDYLNTIGLNVKYTVL